MDLSGGVLECDAVIRGAAVMDLAAIMRHRRGMFSDMGFRDEADLDAMEATSAPFIKAGLENGSYRGWLMERDGNED